MNVFTSENNEAKEYFRNYIYKNYIIPFHQKAWDRFVKYKARKRCFGDDKRHKIDASSMACSAYLNPVPSKEEDFVEWCIQSLFPKAPIVFMFDTTMYCESGCSHCHYSCNTKYPLEKYMPEPDIIYFLNELRREKVEVRSCSFSGGEITHIEKINPGYIYRIMNESLCLGFKTKLLTNGDWIFDNKRNNAVLNTICDLHDLYHECSSIAIQISCDSYHKNCVPNIYAIISMLNEKLYYTTGNHVEINLEGFKHESGFMWNNGFAKGISYDEDKLDVFAKPDAWDLNPVGRAKDNNLPNCRDTKTEFLKACNGNKYQEFSLSCVYFPFQDPFQLFSFKCDGNVYLADVHNQDNFTKFKTPYKNPDGTYKKLSQIKKELYLQMAESVFGRKF